MLVGCGRNYGVHYSGQVVDAQQAPIAGVTVEMFSTETRLPGALPQKIVTDAQGRFELEYSFSLDGQPLTATANSYPLSLRIQGGADAAVVEIGPVFTSSTPLVALGDVVYDDAEIAFESGQTGLKLQNAAGSMVEIDEQVLVSSADVLESRYFRGCPNAPAFCDHTLQLHAKSTRADGVPVRSHGRTSHIMIGGPLPGLEYTVGEEELGSVTYLFGATQPVAQALFLGIESRDFILEGGVADATWYIVEAWVRDTGAYTALDGCAISGSLLRCTPSVPVKADAVRLRVPGAGLDVAGLPLETRLFATP
jgi:hypothetical protein